jgi:predicted 3-demethylubiquinone-9 3-methyltransferase (glyoxalase superfamily)
MKQISLLTAVCSILLCNTAPAPIFSSFSGLSELIDRAEVIVIAQIIKRPDMLDFGNGGIFEIQFVKVLKGTVQERKKATVYLRALPFSVGPYKSATLTHEFEGQNYLLFLNKNAGHIRQDNKPLAVDFENENCSGDAVWVTPEFNYALLEGKELRQSIEAILNDGAKQQRDSAAAMSAMFEDRRANPVQKATPVLWFDDNAEEAANYYVSIFKARPYPEGTSKIMNVIRYSEAGPGPKGAVMGIVFRIEDQEFLALNRGSEDKHTEAPSFALNCSFRDEVDYLREKLSAGGEKWRGGWLRDKFGVSWYVTLETYPADLSTTIPPTRVEK